MKKFLIREDNKMGKKKKIEEKNDVNDVKICISQNGNYRRFSTDSRSDGLQSLRSIMRFLLHEETLEQDYDLDAKEEGYVRRQLKQDFVVIGGDSGSAFWVISDPCDYLDIVQHAYPIYNLTIGEKPKGAVMSKLIILNPYLSDDNLVIWTEHDNRTDQWVVQNLDVSNSELPEMIRQVETLVEYS